MESFSLTDSFLKGYQGRSPQWGYNGLGYVVYKRTYSREMEDGRWEEYYDTCKRVVEGTFDILLTHMFHNSPASFFREYQAASQDQAQVMFDHMWNFRFLPPGRGLSAMGSPLVKRGNGAPLFNCGFVSTDYKATGESFADPFCYLLAASALGIGVGFDTRGKGQVRIVTPSRTHRVHVIGDHREGWEEALRITLNAYVGLGILPTFDYSEIRPYGAKIKTFGGTASGPEALRTLLEDHIPRILTPGLLTSTQITDVANVVGVCVVAGGSRRSSEIGFGDVDDHEFASLKLDMEKLRLWRWASNNSMFIPKDFRDYERFADRVFTNGEPGFCWLDQFFHYGRLRDHYVLGLDEMVKGTNPCGEVGLEHTELCNVADNYPAHCKNYQEFLSVLRCSYLYTKTVSLTKTPWQKTNDLLVKNRRLGISISGVSNHVTKRGWDTHYAWLDSGYRYLRDLDRKVSYHLNVNTSIKLTAIKPGGTTPLLPGVVPGINDAHDRYYIRRVTFSKGQPLLDRLIAAGYSTEVSVYDPTGNTIKVLFPVHEESLRYKRDATLEEQFEVLAQHQALWADNSVSVTINVKPEDREIWPRLMEKYAPRLKSVSFLPLTDHNYAEAPYESITESQYLEMLSKITPLREDHRNEHDTAEKFCDGDSCQLPGF